MSLHIPPGYYQCKFRWRLQGDPEEIISTLGVTPRDDGDRDIVDVAHAMWNAWAGAFEPDTLSDQYSFVGCDVIEGSNDNSGEHASWDEIQVGTSIKPTPCQNCAPLVKKKTAKGGRKNAGRMFLPPGYTPEIEVSPTGAISNAMLALLQSYLTQFLVNMSDSVPTPPEPLADLAPVLFHNDQAMEPTPLTALTIDPRMATQRQRMRR
jgi:hypothetical protein